mgnify:CR=1 FL=1
MTMTEALRVYSFEGITPVVDPSAYVHPTAVLLGDVIVGPGCYVGPGAVLRGDFGRIVMERESNLQDNCVVHTGPDHDTVMEEHAHIGHGAVLHYCRIGRDALVGMNAVVMDDAVVGERSIVAAMSFVRIGAQIPAGVLVAGSPARVVRELGEAPAKLDHAPYFVLVRGPSELDQPVEFVFELGASQRIARVPLGFIHACRKDLTILRGHHDLAYPTRRIGTVHFCVQFHAHALTETGRFRIVPILLELGQARVPVPRNQPENGPHGKLGLMHGLRIDHRAQHIDRALVHLRRDRGDILVTQAICLHGLQQRIGSRMRMPARGMIFERGFGQCPAAAQPIDQFLGIGIGGHARRHALGTFEDVARAGETFGSEGGGGQAVAGRARRV